MTRYAQGVIPHGTSNGYNNYRCRCFSCREAHRVFMGEQRARRFERGVCMECGEPALHGVRCEKHRTSLNESRQQCVCQHRRLHHKPQCSKCGCGEFAKRPRNTGGRRKLVELSPEDRAKAHTAQQEQIKARWAARFPGVDPDMAKAIYREGYQAGHQRARETAKRKILDRIA